jgi:hypothetical protein
MVLWRCIHWSPFPACREPFDQVRVITILSYRNQALCYSRTVAYFSGPALLFSSGDSPQNASSHLSGEGFDEVQPGESPFVVSARSYLPTSLTSLEATTVKLHRPIPRHASTHPGQRQHIVVTLPTRVEGTPPRARTTPPPPQSFEAYPSKLLAHPSRPRRLIHRNIMPLGSVSGDQAVGL